MSTDPDPLEINLTTDEWQRVTEAADVAGFDSVLDFVYVALKECAREIEAGERARRQNADHE